MKVMLFAAGLGTRLKPLTDTMPKALVPVNGHPLIDIVMRKLVAEGADEVVVNVHHFAPMLTDYVASHDWGVPVRISDESDQLLDTGGGLRHAAPLFSQNGRPILIHNVDILSNASLSSFYTQREDADVTLLVSERQTQRYLLFDDDMRLCGWTNVATGEVKSPYPDLDLTHLHKYAFSGIHRFAPRLFKEMDALPDKFPIMDFYLSRCDKLRICGITQPGLRLLDVGKISTLTDAETFLASC